MTNAFEDARAMDEETSGTMDMGALDEALGLSTKKKAAAKKA